MGTAEYQVTPWRAHAPERARVELRGNDHGAAGGERRERRGDEPVHVEERHHAERDVRRPEAVGRRDVRVEIERFAWLSGTRFGRPVLPLVWRISATVVDVDGGV